LGNMSGGWWLYGGLVCIAGLASCLAREPWKLLSENDAGDGVERFYTSRYPDAFGESAPVRRDVAA